MRKESLPHVYEEQAGKTRSVLEAEGAVMKTKDRTERDLVMLKSGVPRSAHIHLLILIGLKAMPRMWSCYNKTS